MKKLKMGMKDWIGLFVSLFFLWLTFRNYSFDLASNSLSLISPIYLLLACISVALTTTMLGVRFRTLFTDAKVNPIPSSFIAGFYNQILPGNLGDLMKLHHINNKYGSGIKRLLAYWGAEKFLSAMIIPMLFVFPMMLVNNVYVKIASSSLISLILVAIVFVFVSYKFTAFKKTPFRLIPFPKIRKYAYAVCCSFFDTLRDLISHQRILSFYAYTLLYYGGVLLYIFSSVKTSHLPDVFVSIESLMLIATITIVANFLPSLPSSAGVMHYGLYQSFIILANHYQIEITPELNNTFVLGTVVFHSVLLLTEITLGVPFVWFERKWLFKKKNENVENI